MDARKTNITESAGAQVGHKKPSRTWMKHWQVIALLVVIYDIIVVNGAYFVALWLRFDCAFSQIPPRYLLAWVKFTPIYTVTCFVVF